MKGAKLRQLLTRGIRLAGALIFILGQNIVYGEGGLELLFQYNFFQAAALIPTFNQFQTHHNGRDMSSVRSEAMF